MPNNPVPFPTQTYLLTLSDSLGLEKPLGGFAEATGLPVKVQGMNKVTDVTLKRGVVDSSDLSAWIQAVRSGGSAIRRNVVLTLRDSAGVPMTSWRFSDAYPTKYAGPTLGGKGNDIAIEELVLASEAVEWIPPK
jgi:phage tail-like protein